MKLLIVGNGGREHALAWKLASDSSNPRIFCAPGNAGTAAVATNLPCQASDLDAICEWAEREKPDLTIVGPEAPLCSGLTDALEARGLAVFGPRKEAARLEGSKSFAKEIMQSANVPTAEAKEFSDSKQACAYIDQKGAPIVIKADGLAAGKGVTVCQTVEEARGAVREALDEEAFGKAGTSVLIEECLRGEEASILGLVDGENFVLLSSSQDHKPAYDNDKGPNTGGMGAYSPAPIVTEEVIQELKRRIYKPTLAELKKRGITYKGILYAGLMIEDGKPRVVEFNCRFGDPETQVILTRWKGDLLPALMACAEGNLKPEMVDWRGESSVCVVMASGGYPGSYQKGHPIAGIEKANALAETVVFQAGTKQKGDQIISNGGRVLGVTALGRDLKSAVANTYLGVEKISWKDSFYRTDIASKELRRKR